MVSLAAWCSKNAHLHPDIARAAQLYQDGRWNGASIRTLEVTIATRNLWHTHKTVVSTIVQYQNAHRAEPAYQYTLTVPDDDDPLVMMRPHLYTIGSTIEWSWVTYRVVGGACTLDCGQYSHFVLQCEIVL